MVNTKKIKQIFKLNLSKPITLLVFYLIIRDININIPYLNLLTNNWEVRALILFIFAMILYKPSYKILIYLGIGLILIYGILLIFFERRIEIFGLAVYLLLVLILINFFRKLND